MSLPPGATLVSGEVPQNSALPAGATLVSGTVPEAPETGVWAGIKRNTVGMINGLYHAFSDPATSEEKQELLDKIRAENAQGEKIPEDLATNPSRVTLAYHRLIDAPAADLSQKSNNEITAAKDLLHQGENWKGGNLYTSGIVDKGLAAVPMVGPWINSIGQRYESGDVSGAATDIAAGLAFQHAKPIAEALGKGVPSSADVALALRTPGGALKPGVKSIARLAGTLGGHALGIPGAGELGGYLVAPGLADMLIPNLPTDIPGNVPPTLPSSGEFYETKGADLMRREAQQRFLDARARSAAAQAARNAPPPEPPPVYPGASLPSAEDFYENRAQELMDRQKQQDVLDRAKASQEKAQKAAQERLPSLTTLPLRETVPPRPLTPESVPGPDTAGKGNLLTPIAKAGDVRAGQELMRRGRNVLYVPEGGFPGPRSVTSFGGELKGEAEPEQGDYAYRVRNQGDTGVPISENSGAHATTDLEDAKRLMPGRQMSEGGEPQEIGRIDLSKLKEGKDFVRLPRGEDLPPWIKFLRPLGEHQVELLK